MLIKIDVADVHKIAAITTAEMIYVTAKRDIKLTAVTEEITVIVAADGYIETSGEFLISKEVINSLPESGELTITDTDLICGNRKIKFNPKYESVSDRYNLNEVLKVSKKEFDKLIKVDYAIAKDETRPVLNNICIKNNNFTALDGFRIAFRKSTVETEEEILLNTHLIKAYKKVKSKIGNVEILKSKDYTAINVDNITIISKTTSEKYIKYESLIPKDFTTIATRINTKEFLNILKSYSKMKFIDLFITTKGIEVKGNTEKVSIKDSLQAVVTGKDLEISFNPKYIIEALKHQDKEIEFKFTSKLSPALIESELETDLVVPVRKVVE